MTQFSDIELPKDSEIAMALIRRILWSTYQRKSFVSGLWLRTYFGTVLWANCFLHVLSIEKFRYFKYYYKNIILVSPGEAGLWHQGSEEERIGYALTIEQNSRGEATADWNKLKALAIELKEEYQEYFPLTKNGIVGYRYPLDEQGKIISKLNKKFLSENK